jgi:alpha-L-rhamnosidase
MFGDISAWLFKTLAGISPVDAGFRHFRIHPHLMAGLTWARGTHDSPYGRIRSSWEMRAEKFILEVDIPGNTTATVVLPARDAQQVTEGGQLASATHGITLQLVDAAGVTFHVQSGKYRFAVDPPYSFTTVAS